MPLTIANEHATYQCNACGNLLGMKKEQLLPPCPRAVRRTNKKHEGVCS